MFEAGLDRGKTLELYRILDWLLRLPEGLERAPELQEQGRKGQWGRPQNTQNTQKMDFLAKMRILGACYQCQGAGQRKQEHLGSCGSRIRFEAARGQRIVNR